MFKLWLVLARIFYQSFNAVKLLFLVFFCLLFWYWHDVGLSVVRYLLSIVSVLHTTIHQLRSITWPNISVTWCLVAQYFCPLGFKVHVCSDQHVFIMLCCRVDDGCGAASAARERTALVSATPTSQSSFYERLFHRCKHRRTL